MSVRISGLDFIAGLSVASLLLPESVAYASIAGLEPQHGIFAAIAGLAIYALVGRSRFAIVSPTSSSAAILAAAAATAQSPFAPEQRWALAAGAVLLTGGFFILAALFRLGALGQFISRPVLRGFAFGIAATIILRQIPPLIGVHVDRTDALGTVLQLATAIHDVHQPSLMIGCGSLAALLLLKGWPRVPAAFLVVIAAGFAASQLGLEGAPVDLVGAIDIVPFRPGVPDLPWPVWQRLAQIALPLVLIIYAESWGAMRTFALRHGDALNPTRELFALGLANVVSGLARGMPVGAGFSAASANEGAGAQSRLAGVVAACVFAAAIALFGSQVERIPLPALAAVVISAVAGALDPRPLIRLWRINRDQYVALAAALGVILLGVVDGMVLAVALSVVATLSRMASPRVEFLGRLGDTQAFVDLRNHPEAATSPAILVVRPSEPLFFANAETVFASIGQAIRNAPQVRAVILSLEESSNLDSTAIDTLGEFEARARELGKLLLLARSKQHVRNALARASSPLAAPDRNFWSVDEAYRAAAKAVQGVQLGERGHVW